MYIHVIGFGGEKTTVVVREVLFLQHTALRV